MESLTALQPPQAMLVKSSISGTRCTPNAGSAMRTTKPNATSADFRMPDLLGLTCRVTCPVTWPDPGRPRPDHAVTSVHYLSSTILPLRTLCSVSSL